MPPYTLSKCVCFGWTLCGTRLFNSRHKAGERVTQSMPARCCWGMLCAKLYSFWKVECIQTPHSTQSIPSSLTGVFTCWPSLPERGNPWSYESPAPLLALWRYDMCLPQVELLASMTKCQQTANDKKRITCFPFGSRFGNNNLDAITWE